MMHAEAVLGARADQQGEETVSDLEDDFERDGEEFVGALCEAWKRPRRPPALLDGLHELRLATLQMRATSRIYVMAEFDVLKSTSMLKGRAYWTWASDWRSSESEQTVQLARFLHEILGDADMVPDRVRAALHDNALRDTLMEASIHTTRGVGAFRVANWVKIDPRLERAP